MKKRKRNMFFFSPFFFFVGHLETGLGEGGVGYSVAKIAVIAMPGK